MKMHKSVTVERVMAAVQAEMTSLENPGICISCGADAEGCEPDARNYACNECGKTQVYGAQELLMHLA